MGRFTRTLRPAVTITGAAVIWLAAVLGVGAAGPSGQGPAPAAKAAVAPAPAAQAPSSADGYVGEAACLEC